MGQGNNDVTSRHSRWGGASDDDRSPVRITRLPARMAPQYLVVEFISPNSRQDDPLPALPSNWMDLPMRLAGPPKKFKDGKPQRVDDFLEAMTEAMNRTGSIAYRVLEVRTGSIHDPDPSRRAVRSNTPRLNVGGNK